jgi:hypothetical protein
MLFQTHYHIDPYDGFEPPLYDCTPVCIRDAVRHSELHFLLQHPSHEEDRTPARLLIFLNRNVQSVPTIVVQALAGECISIGQKRSEPRTDGFQDFPHSYRDFLQQLTEDMDSQATEIFNLLRWRHGINGGPLALKSDARSIRWQNDNRNSDFRHLYPFLNSNVPVGVVELDIPQGQEIRISDADRKAVEALLGSDSLQPLHHDLLREAWQNQRSNPRSSLVLCMAALETAVKSTLCELNESLRWLLENLPSPPIDKFLRDYLPDSPARNTIRGKVLSPPAPLLTSIRKGIEQRNRLVHGREDTISYEALQEILFAVRDTAYLLDFYRGHEWALERIRLDTRKALMPGPITP